MFRSKFAEKTETKILRPAYFYPSIAIFEIIYNKYYHVYLFIFYLTTLS